MRHTFLALIPLLLSASINAQDFYFITQQGEKIISYAKHFDFEPSGIGYWPEPDKNRMKVMGAEEIKVLYAGGRVFLTLPVTKRESLLQEIIAFNDKHILTTLLMGSANIPALCLYDWDYNLILDRIHASHMPKDRESVLEIVKTHFNNCDDLIKKVAENKNSTDKWRCPLDNISVIKCGNKDFLETLLK